MVSRSGWRFRSWVWLQLLCASAAIAVAWFVFRAHLNLKSPGTVDRIESDAVRRVDMRSEVVVGGEVRFVKETMITCQVEDITDSGGTMIVQMIGNGTPVKKGDEICRLDSSQLEEIGRGEEITVITARSTYLQAQLSLEVARIALREYRDGLVLMLTKDFEVRIALARSDSEKLAERAAWTEAMVAKGYSSKGQLATERQALLKTTHELRTAEGEFQVFKQFQVPKEIVTLQGNIETADNNYQLEAARLRTQEDRLAHIRKQIESCTVRAPHDGIAVYAKRRSWRAEPLAPGVRVYQGQELFKIPDLGQMEVEVSIHETIGPRVRVGMPATVRIESIGDRVIAGKVVSMIPFPIQNDKEWDEHLRHYLARVQLNETPRDLRPTMSAKVEIHADQVPDALVVPVEAVSVVDGGKCCYVLAPGGVERRSITTGRSTIDLVEITGGLREGERVVSQFTSVHEMTTKKRKS